MKHRLYKYRENMLVLGFIDFVAFPLYFRPNEKTPWLKYLVLPISIVLIILGLIYLILIFKSEHEEKVGKTIYVKVKKVKYEYIKTCPSSRHKRRIIGYRFYADGKSYIYMSEKDIKLEAHISKIYAFEYYKTLRMVKTVKYN